MVLTAWLILYREWPKWHQFWAILTHDLGYWGCPNMDGKEGGNHPERLALWWRKHFPCFGVKVAVEILGHSRRHTENHGLELSKLFRPDKLSSALYPKWLYLLLANLSGEIHEYMNETGGYGLCAKKGGTQIRWLIEMQAHLALLGIAGGCSVDKGKKGLLLDEDGHYFKVMGENGHET